MNNLRSIAPLRVLGAAFSVCFCRPWAAHRPLRWLGPLLGCAFVALSAPLAAQGSSEPGSASLPPIDGRMPAGATPEQRASALLRRAALAERQGQPAQALGHYRAAFEANPGGRLGRRATRRVEYLEARSEGGFEPLRQLLLVRSDRDPGRLERFREALDGFPSGLVRREGWQLLAQRYQQGGANLPAAEAAYRRWLAEESITEDERRIAQSGLARLLGELGRAEEAAALVQEPELREVAEDLERQAATPLRKGVAAGLVLLFLAFVVVAIRRGHWAPRAVPRGRWLALSYVFVGPWSLAAAFDVAAFDTFALLTASLAPLVGLAFCVGAGLGSASLAFRRLGAALVVAAHLGAAFWVLLAQEAVLGIAS